MKSSLLCGESWKAVKIDELAIPAPETNVRIPPPNRSARGPLTTRAAEPILGTRKLVTYSTALLLLPLVGWSVAVRNPSTPFIGLLALGFLSGLGGGIFSGFMPSTSYFFPKSKQGMALGLQAGIGNFGVSIVQFVTPLIVASAMFGATLGAPQHFVNKDKGIDTFAWYQNAGLLWVPFVLVAVVLAWTMLKSVPIKARGVSDQLDIFKNKHTWLMTLLYVMTFGTFSGLSAQFGLLIKNLFGEFACSKDWWKEHPHQT